MKYVCSDVSIFLENLILCELLFILIKSYLNPISVKDLTDSGCGILVCCTF